MFVSHHVLLGTETRASEKGASALTPSHLCSPKSPFLTRGLNQVNSNSLFKTFLVFLVLFCSFLKQSLTVQCRPCSDWPAFSPLLPQPPGCRCCRCALPGSHLVIFSFLRQGFPVQPSRSSCAALAVLGLPLWTRSASDAEPSLSAAQVLGLKAALPLQAVFFFYLKQGFVCICICI